MMDNKRYVLAIIGEDWSRQWPCGALRPGDAVRATFAANGDLVDLEAPDRARGGEAAELDAALERYGRWHATGPNLRAPLPYHVYDSSGDLRAAFYLLPDAKRYVRGRNCAAGLDDAPALSDDVLCGAVGE
jgi:hypothetical protein